jgi:hypothetical protein
MKRRNDDLGDYPATPLEVAIVFGLVLGVFVLGGAFVMIFS